MLGSVNRAFQKGHSQPRKGFLLISPFSLPSNPLVLFHVELTRCPKNPEAHVYSFVLGPYGQDRSRRAPWHHFEKHFFSEIVHNWTVRIYLANTPYFGDPLMLDIGPAQGSGLATNYGWLQGLEPYVWALASPLACPRFLQGATSGLQH